VVCRVMIAAAALLLTAVDCRGLPWTAVDCRGLNWNTRACQGRYLAQLLVGHLDPPPSELASSFGTDHP
jgi:hypothetical protein